MTYGHDSGTVNVDNPEGAFDIAYEEELRGLRRPTVLVAGYTGAGKSSLIQAICGRDVLPDDRIGHGLPRTMDFDFYEDSRIRFWDSRGLEPGEAEAAFVERTQAFIRELQDRPDVDDHVHLVWYAIQGPGARVTPHDLKLIREVFPNTIVVITKSDATRRHQLDAMRQALLDGGVDPQRIRVCSEEDQDSLRALVDLSYHLLPEAYRAAFVAAQQVHLGRKWEHAQRVIHAAAAAAAAAGASPLPCSDSPIIMGIQYAMIARLAYVYNERAEAVKAGILPVLTAEGGILLASSLGKGIPILGNIVQASIAAGLTEALGQLIALYFAERARARAEERVPPEFTVGLEELMQMFWEVMRTRPWASSTSRRAAGAPPADDAVPPA